MKTLQLQHDDKVPGLEGHEVHVWVVDLSKNQSEFEHLLTLVEQQKIQRLIYPHHRACSLSMRVQLRVLLSRYLQLEPESVEIGIAEYGKPYLKGSNLRFNLSHSGDVALVAVSLEEVGVDIEHWRPLDNMDALVKRNFSLEEQKQWQSIPVDKHEATFFDTWACKEAFIKSTGRGLGLGVSRCGFDLFEGHRLVQCPTKFGDISEWSCELLSIAKETGAAVVLRATSCSPRVLEFNL